MLKNLVYKLKRKLRILKPRDYLQHLRDVGIKIGKGTVFFSTDIYIDEQRPWMISIGEYCKITDGVIVLQHDYSRSVLRRKYGDIVGESKKTTIGDNVFIGMKSIILMGTDIGNNVIVGAGSVVSGHIPDNVVVAGNPARIIRTLDEHYEIRKQKYIDEAKETARLFIEKYGRNPSEKEMGSFFPLFLQRDRRLLKSKDIFTNLSGDNEADIIECWLNSEPIYDGIDDFLREV